MLLELTVSIVVISAVIAIYWAGVYLPHRLANRL